MPLHLRIARPVSDIERTKDMYCRGLGLRVIGRFENHDGFDGIMLGVAGANCHFEFTHSRKHPVRPAPTVEDLAVFYTPAESEWQATCAGMLAAGFTQVTAFNQYWEVRGRTYEDRDGYRIVLQQAEGSYVAQADPLSADDQFFAALLGVNRDALDRLLAPDFLLIDVMTGSEILRAPFLGLVGSGQLVFDAIDPADGRVRRYQDVAVITGRTHMRGRFGGAPFAASSWYTHVFLERESRWRLMAAQGTPITPPPRRQRPNKRLKRTGLASREQ